MNHRHLQMSFDRLRDRQLKQLVRLTSAVMTLGILFFSPQNSNSISGAANWSSCREVITGPQPVFINNTSFTIPQGCKRIRVKIWAAGGGAGGGGINNSGGNDSTGGSGGAGAYVEVVLGVIGGQTYTIKVGEAGQGGFSTNSVGSGRHFQHCWWKIHLVQLRRL